MLRAMNHVMRLQREEVKDNPVLLSAWRQGNAYWKDHFGAAASEGVIWLSAERAVGAERPGPAQR